jgi:cold shock CspA family protein
MHGTVIRLLLNRGFGFVRGEDGLTRLIHVNNFIDKIAFERLREGQGVSFDPVDDGPRERNSNGLRGVNVQVDA